MSDETKIVINHKNNGATIGIQRTNCDPILFTAQGDLSTVISGIKGFLEEAGRRWQTNPRYPKAELPTPPPTQATTVTHQASNSQAKPSSKQQEAMF